MQPRSLTGMSSLPRRCYSTQSPTSSRLPTIPASQNMFLNIFFLRPTMHGGPLLNSWDFHAFYALWLGHCGLNHRRCHHRRGGSPSGIRTFRTGRRGAVTLPAVKLATTRRLLNARHRRRADQAQGANTTRWFVAPAAR